MAPRNLQKPKKRRNLSELFERGKFFLESIGASDSILLIHHTDVDGYCSAAVLISALKKLDKGNVDVVAAANEELESLAKSRKLAAYKKIIILDIDAPYLIKYFEKMNGLLIIDHHIPKADLNSDKIVYINPRLGGEKTYEPTSYVVYKLLSSFVDLKDVEWVAVMGTVADFAFDDCKDLLDGWIQVENKKDMTKTDFWKVAKMLYGVIIMGTKDVIDMLLEYRDIYELKSDTVLLATYARFKKEYEKVRQEFWKNAEEINNIIISKVDPDYKRVGSALSTDIGLENEDKILIILEKRGKKFKIHSRCQSGRVHMGKLMEKCCTLGGGGHEQAAGGSIKTSDFEKFKKCLLAEVR